MKKKPKKGAEKKPVEERKREIESDPVLDIYGKPKDNSQKIKDIKI